HRRAGVGRTLVEAAAVIAAAAGARALFLEVASDNDAALALYRSAGFARAGQRPGYYRRGAGAVDALVLRRDLNRPPA
ncbi:MAG TPA: GNAT family N-acetyltransferase, partial [Caulobacteraceae bacterium]|nr:GNAT family N-acetyltransferase [Caulobacteraceae bacterium]